MSPAAGRDERIRAMARDGLSTREIAERVQLSKSRVNQILAGYRLRVELHTTGSGVELRSAEVAPEDLSTRVRRALELAKIEVITGKATGA